MQACYWLEWDLNMQKRVVVPARRMVVVVLVVPPLESWESA